MITVVIPTANRPAYLRTALASVRAQVARRHIGEVIVSENAGCRESQQVCEEFQDLPIRYVFREPAFTATEHGEVLVKEATCDLVAFLCDDDWWAPYHLAGAVEALADGEVSAYYSCNINTADETIQEVQICRRYPLWLAAGRPPFFGVWRMDTKQVLAIAWLYTPFHLSGVVARSSFFARAIDGATEMSGWCVDRLMFARLAESGVTVFQPHPQIYVRVHQSNDSRNFLGDKGRDLHRIGTEEVAKIAARHGMDLAGLWREILADKSVRVTPELAGSFVSTLTPDEILQVVGGDASKLAWLRGVATSGRKSRRLLEWLPAKVFRRICRPSSLWPSWPIETPAPASVTAPVRAPLNKGM
ncbi:MAG: glycosyltransferase family 2 protein [Chthoniobacterales bacterium]